MERNPKNKVVVITGAAQGIGFHIADNFLKNGAKVIILDINNDLGEEVVKAFNAKYDNNADFFKCDVTKDLEPISKAIIDKYKTVHVLVNNAGILNDYKLRKTIEINIIAVMEWTFKFWEHMRVDNGGIGGTILNIASMYGYLVDPCMPIYKASKYAVVGFTNTMGHKACYEKYGVRVAVLCPGFTDTDILSNLEEKAVVMKDEFLEYVKKSSLQNPEEVGKAAIELFEKADSGTIWSIVNGRIIAPET